MNDDPFSGPEWERFADAALRDLAPQVERSALTVSFLPKDHGDVKFAIELGFSVMMDKPIILIVRPGCQVPAKVVAVADRIIEGDLTDAAETARRLRIAMMEVIVDGPDGDPI
jgi:hypothetical protein